MQATEANRLDTPTIRGHLLYGPSDPHGASGAYGPPYSTAEPTDAELEQAWRELRDVLLPEFVARHPGSRPWAWWRWDAPEPRRVIEHRERAVYQPIPGKVSLHEWTEPESERAYLERLGLLQPGE